MGKQTETHLKTKDVFDFRVKLIPDEEKYVIAATIDNQVMYRTSYNMDNYKGRLLDDGKEIKNNYAHADWILKLRSARRWSKPDDAIRHIQKQLYPFHYSGDENMYLDTVWDQETGYHPNKQKEIAPLPKEMMPDDPFFYKLISYLSNATNTKNWDLEHAIAEVVNHHMNRTGMYEDIFTDQEVTV